MLGLLNSDGKGRGIEAPTITADPVQLHLTVSGTVGWTDAASKIKLIKVLSPE